MSSEGCCCPPGSWPALKSDYVPKFHEEDLAGYNTYVAGNINEQKKVVLLIPDIFGINSGRTKAIADSFNNEGFYTVVPDLFKGDTFPEGADIPSELPAWAKKFPHELVKQSISQVVAALKEKGATEIYLGGFCWGLFFLLFYH